ncbi:protein tesmin/TSO1-like CXC 5 [Argentina anserina]|uniref:protein tesmin/TSO1-like CXC 5 n=1 Tax=Argentina anserina TaxID=57926 RepID=UPI0021767E02|nr:protein tesmin/TSO1-like CXC 5 [Potentilla anserina]
MGEGDGADSAPTEPQSDAVSATATTSTSGDVPAKKLARQLDFTALGATARSVALPEAQKPQVPPATVSQSQPRPQVAGVPVPQPPQSQPRPQGAGVPVPQPQQSQLRPQGVRMPVPQPPHSQPRPQVAGVSMPQPPQSQPRPQVVGMPVPPQQPPVPSVRPVKPDSPKRPRPNVDGKDGTPKKQKQCNCKHSRCLKLYCECFASGIYCDGCNCVNCCNNVENEGARRDAVEATLERNPNAFRPKIASSPHGPRDSREEAGELVVLAKHNKGCHCKKSGCLKKYCECFQANILCSENCKCIDCKNFEGSAERQALFHGDHNNNIAYLQQAANAAITDAIGSSGYISSPPISKKRKGQEIFFGQTAKDQSAHRIGQYPQANHLRPPAPSSSSAPVTRLGTAGLGPSKFTYRSLLADIIQPQDLKELCSVLVVVAEEAAKTLADRRSAAEKEAETSLATTTEDGLQSQKESDTQKVVTDDCTTANQADQISPEDSNSDGVDGPKGRPMSPGTLALMCDEQDTMFMSAASPSRLIGDGYNISSQLPNGQGMTEVYTEQERVVLAKFRGCLNMLITRGELKEAECSSLARSEAVAQREQIIGNGTSNPRMEIGSQQRPVSNGVVPPTARTSQMVTAAVSSPSTVPPRPPAVPQNGGNKPKA